MLDNTKALNPEDLEQVNGGMIVYAQGLDEFNPLCPYEVIEK